MSSASSSSRRDFIKLSGLASAGLLATKGVAAAVPSGKLPKNLIFLVADGMGTGTLSLAQAYSEQVLGRSTEWFELYKNGHFTRSFQDTASANSPVTDSAAAGSSWGCGQRVNNGAINFTPDGSMPKPLFVLAKEAGKATGLVSTCRITHATPASFVANVESRGSEDAIADQFLERELDVYLGGGVEHFKREDSDLTQSFEEKGYAFATDKKSLKKAAGKGKLLGLFSEGHIPYAIDRRHSGAHDEVPGLEMMFESALDALAGRPEGFMLQVEAGRIDHAGHANDPAAILHEQLEFDRCLPIALKFLKKNPDTLLVLTTDHGTGGCQLNGVGRRYAETNEALHRLSKMSGSFESIEADFRKSGTFDGERFSEMTGISVSEAQVQQVVDTYAEIGGYFSSSLVAVFAEELLKKTGVGFSSGNHTSEHVEFVAIGPGHEAFPPFIKNYEVNGILRDLLKV